MSKWDDIKQERIGQIRVNKDGVEAIVVDYINADNVIYQYTKYGGTNTCKWERYNKGKFATPKEYYIENKVGQRRCNKNKEWATCIEYISADKVIIQFDSDGRHEVVAWGNYNKGLFGYKHKHNMFGGIYDLYEPIKDDNGNIPKEYDAWHSILKRCYSEATHSYRNTYIECEISEEWKYYSNFLKWIYSQVNYEKWKNGGKNWHVDKDILVKNNKIYGKEYCLLVPSTINGLLLKCDASRGKYPIGVYYDKSVDLFRVRCQNPLIGKQITVGLFETSDDAFYKGYKPYKERIIQMVAADEFNKGNITKECFDALNNYQVEITD